MNGLKERVAKRMRELDLSQQELADRIGIKQPSVNNLLKGKIRRPRFITDLAKALSVTTEWLETGRELENTPPHGRMQEGTFKKPAAAARGAGKPAGANEELLRAALAAQGFLSLPVYDTAAFRQTGEAVISAHFLKDHSPTALENLGLIVQESDAMAPTLKEGATLLVDFGHTRPTPPGLYLVEDKTGITVRRLQSLPAARLRVASDNPAYGGFDAPAKTITLKGRVLAFWGRS
jgi:transcriptional regulator with XRE-family HTH domain